MKTIGLLGGMSWQSTQGYYQAINEAVAQRLGKLHSAKIALYSLDFAPIEQLQHQGDWEGCAKILCQAAQRVEVAGADCLLICTNTMHKLAPQVEAAISIPLLHIADATAQRIQAQGLSRIGLLGTAFTMDEAFYKGRMADKYGLDVRVPNAADRQRVHQVIYDELCLGKVNPESRQAYLRIIESLGAEGAEAVILGCTEIGMLVSQADSAVPLFDTTKIHAQAAVEFALS
tara:strand:- start:754 stop:1446 length:693 start_codon:yes stop_codon:yes gene_type:complete